MNYPKAFNNLVECFKRLPGVGGKSAERLAYHVLSMDQQYVQEFSDVLATFQSDIKYCETCGHICEDIQCDICIDTSRDSTLICVVESPKDVFAMEKVREYRGVYHVLHGTMSIMEGRTLEDLNVISLLDRLNDTVKEVIIATNPTRDGETTALYLAKLIAAKEISTSRIANGLPIGSNIDYADELTLLKSLEGRKKM